MRGPVARVIVVEVSSVELLHIHLDIDRCSAPVTGDVRMEGAAPRPFVGWTELFVALREALGGGTSTNEWEV
jgi:hypothetical protein